MFAGGRSAGAGEAHQRELHRSASADDSATSATRRRLATAARRVLPGSRGSDAAAEGPQLQVLLRLQISRPRLHNVLTTFKLSLAGEARYGACCLWHL